MPSRYQRRKKSMKFRLKVEQRRKEKKENALARKLLDVNYELPMFSELIIEVDEEPHLNLLVVDGIAEICGAKLENNFKYTFRRFSSVTMFTYHGCTLVVSKGKASKCTISTETSMDNLLNVHLSLEKYREDALKTRAPMPVTICVGGTQSGKLVGVETLMNYSLRQNPEQDRKIFYVDLNHSHNLLSIPGSLGACIVQNPSVVREGFLLGYKNSHIYCFGHTNPFEKIMLYKYYMHKLSTLLKAKKEIYPNLEVIINIPSWIQGSGYKLLLKTCQEFQVSHIIVFDSCIAYNQLIEDMPLFVKVIHLPRILSTLLQSQRIRREQTDLIFEYFCGTLRQPFTPYRIELKLEDVKLLVVTVERTERVVPNTATRKILKSAVSHINNHLPDCIAGVLHIPASCSRKLDEYHRYPVRHYLCLLGVSTHRGTVDTLSPLPRDHLPLPLYLLATDQKLVHSYKSQHFINDPLKRDKLIV